MALCEDFESADGAHQRVHHENYDDLDEVKNCYAAIIIKQEPCDEAEDQHYLPAMPQLAARSQSRRKVKEEEKAVKASRKRSHSMPKSPGKQAGAEPPKVKAPAEQVPKVGAKRGRPKKSPDSNETSLKRLSISYFLTFIELDDQTHLSPAVANMSPFPQTHPLASPRSGMPLPTLVHQGSPSFVHGDATGISARSLVRDPRLLASPQSPLKSPHSPRDRDRSPNATCTTNNTTQVSYTGKMTKEEFEPKDSRPQRKPKVQRSKSTGGNPRFALFLRKVEQSDPKYLEDDPTMLKVLEEFFEDTTTRYVPDEVDAKYSKNHKDI